MFAASKSGSVEDKDAQFNYVTMLLHGDGTNGSQNNTFLDSSTNNFTITRNGNTTQGTFTPYGSNWSNYFDGTGDYLQTPSNSAFNFSATDCTLEFWYFGAGSGGLVFEFGSSAPDTAAMQCEFSSGTLTFKPIGASSSFFAIQTNAWNYIAAVKTGTTYYLYINGTRNTSSTGTAASTGQIINIGARNGGSVAPITGYLSNFRVSNTARYTGTTMTVPTAPTSSDANTVLLTCQSNRFIDNSSNAFTVTKAGDVSVQRFSPFSPTTAYSTSVIGGSAYLDGTGDYLTLPVSSAFDLGTNACCVEAWVYLTNNNIFGIFTSSNSTSGQTRPNFYARYDQLQLDYFGNVVIQANITVTLNCWHHVVFTRAASSGAWRIFLDGVLQAYEATGSQNLLQTGAAQEVGRTYAGTTGQGYMGDVRIVNGAVPSAYVTSSTTTGTQIFTPPTAPLTAISSTSLLLSYTNAGILDNAMMNDLETVGNAQISTSVKKYGTGSMYFDGTGDYLISPAVLSNSLGSGDFTFECWIYATTASDSPIYDSRSNTDGFTVTAYSSTVIRVYTTAVLVTATVANYVNSWTHVAFTRQGSTNRLFVNGTLVATATASDNFTNTTSIIGGGRYGSNSVSAYFTGYIDDLRITKGVARYTANFTAPTAAFADKG